MTTRELIQMLQDIDPSGNIEVGIGNAPIIEAEYLPAYYDGRLQVLSKDRQSIQYRRKGFKIKLRSYDVEDLLLDYPEAEVTCDSDFSTGELAEIEKYREQGRRINAKIQPASEGE